MNSRVCVKYLPRECNEDLLRKHFSSCGIITDCRVMKTPSGKSRQFGFVGFSDQESRDRALKLNHSYIRTCQIAVEEAHPYKSEKLPRAWSKYSRGTSEFKKREEKMVKIRENRKKRKVKLKKKKEKIKAKKLLEEENDEIDKFLSGENSVKAIWENDDFEIPDFNKKSEKESEKVNRKETERISKIEKEDNVIPPPPPTSGVVHQSSMSDLDWLKSKTVKTIEEKDEEEEEEELGPGKKKKKKKKKSSSKPAIEEGRLFIRNLSYSVREEDLEKLFSQHGDLSEVFYPIDKYQKKPKGYAFVTYVIPSNSQKAKKALNGNYFFGRIMHILPAYESRTKNQHIENATKNVKSGYKKKMKKHQKLAAGSAFNWNTLYIRPDAAVAGIAKELGLSQGTLTGVGEDDGGAVRVALAETQALQELRDSLRGMGISVEDVFKSERDKKRSNTIMLVKNLSEGTTESEIRELFGKFGEVRQVKMVLSSGTFAVVRFFGRNEANNAFQNLCYQQFKGRPLYLEWAPLQQKRESDSKVETVDGVVVVQKVKQKVDEDEDDDEEDEEEEVKEANNTLYIKNLNFKTTGHELSEFIRKSTNGLIVPTNSRIVKDDIGLSKGYGFVTFSSTKKAIEVRRKVSGKVLSGHQLVVSFSRLEESELKKKRNVTGLMSVSSVSSLRNERKRSKTKIIVKNLAFEATRRDLFELFGTFGEIKEIRIPRKVSGGHRGFGFVEFVSEGECEGAMKALRNTHLYGRSLVLEFALEEETVENLRETVRSDLLRKRKRSEMIQSDGRVHFKKNKKKRRIEGK